MWQFRNLTPFYVTFVLCSGLLPYSVPNLLSEDSFQSSADSILQDILEKYSESDPNEHWQPFTLINDQNREVVQVENVQKTNMQGQYLAWKRAQIGSNIYLVGLSQKSLDLYGSDLKQIAAFKFGKTGRPVAMTVFTNWNNDVSLPEIIIAVATTKPSVELYRIIDNVITKFPESWPLHYQINGLECAHTGAGTKLILRPAEEKLIDIYNIATNNTHTQLWFHQRINADGNSSVAVLEIGQVSTIAVTVGQSIIIYSFDFSKGHYVNSKSVLLNAPSIQLVSFTWIYEHFLASVAFESGFVEFFSVTANAFVREEKLKNKIRATQIRPVVITDFHDEPVLITKQPNGQIDFLVFDANSKTLRTGFNCTASPAGTCSTTADFERGTNYISGGTSVVVLPSDSSSNSFDVLFVSKRVTQTASPEHVMSRTLLSEFELLNNIFARWERVTSTTQSILQNSISKTNPNVVTGSWHVRKLSSAEVVIRDGERIQDREPASLQIENIFGDFQFVDSTWQDKDFDTKLSEIDHAIAKLTAEIEAVDSIILRESIPIDSRETEIVSAPQIFLGSLKVGTLDAIDIAVQKINNQQDVTGFLNNIATNEEEDLTVEHALIFRGELSVNNLRTTVLNDVNTTDIARLDHRNVFNCPLRFATLFKVDGSVHASEIGGVKLSEEVIRASDVQGVKFKTGIVALKDATISTPINSVVVDKNTFEKLLLKSGRQHITAPYFFDQLITSTNVSPKTLNEKGFQELWDSLVFADTTTPIRGRKHVAGQVTTDSLWIQDTLNGLRFPEDFVTGRRGTITGNKKFARLSAETVKLASRINNINTNELVSALGHATLRNTWRFKDSVTFVDDLTVKNLVDGVKMELLKHVDTLDQGKSTYNPNANVEFVQPIHFGNLAIDSTINGRAFDEIFGGIFQLTPSTNFISGLTSFKSNVVFDSLRLKTGQVNGLSVNEFFTTHTKQNITGAKIFAGEIGFTLLYVLGRFDSVFLSELFKDAFRLNQPRTISTRLSFESVSCGSTMTVEGQVNNFKDFASEVAVTRGRKVQHFQTKINFENFQAKSLKVTDDLFAVAGKTIGGFDVRLWNTNKIPLENPDKIKLPFEITGTGFVEGNIQTEAINGIKIQHITSLLLRSDRIEQTFLDSFETTGLVKVDEGKIRIERNVNGLPINQIIANAFHIRSTVSEIIRGNWHFESIVVSNELNVKGTTCLVDLEKLESDTVHIGETDVQISAPKHFKGGFHIRKDLKVKHINSIDYFTFAFTLHTPQTIEKKVAFQRNVHIEELSGMGSINRISLPELKRMYSFDINTRTHTIQFDLESDETIESVHLIVRKLVQSQDFAKFLSNKVAKINPNQKIKGRKIFLSPVRVEGNMNTITLNGMILDNFFNSIIRKSDSIRFNNAVVIQNTAKSPKLIIRGDLVGVQEIDSVNLAHLAASAVYMKTSLTRTPLKLESATIMNNVDDVITLNDIRITDIVTLTDSRDVGTFQVAEVHIDGRNVDVDGLISGFDIRKEFENTLWVKSRKTQFVTGLKVFQDSVTFAKNFNCHGQEMNKLVSIHEDTLVTAKVDFIKKIHVKQDLEISNLTNGHSIRDMLANSLTNGRKEEITGFWTFNGGVTFQKNVEGKGLVNGIDLSAIIPEKLVEANHVKETIQQEVAIYEKTCRLMDSLHLRISQSPVKLQSFDSHQTIVLGKSASKIITLKSAENLHLLTFSKKTCEITFYEWSAKEELFEEISRKLRIGHVTSWDSVTFKESSYLIFSTTQQQSGACSTITNGLYITTLRGGEYSETELLKSGLYPEVKIVANKNKVAIFALNFDRLSISVFHANENSKFTSKKDFKFREPVIQFQVTDYQGGVAIFHYCEDAVHMHFYNLETEEFDQIGKIPFAGSNVAGSRAAVLFASQDSLYGVIQTGSSQESIIQPDCTLQSFQLFDGELKLLQRLKTHHTLSISKILVDKQMHLAILSKFGGTLIYEFAGLGGFQILNENPIPIVGGIDMISFAVDTWRSTIDTPFLAILKKKSIDILHSNIQGDQGVYPGKRDCKVT